jgi:hypothetical protein
VPQGLFRGVFRSKKGLCKSYPQKVDNNGEQGTGNGEQEKTGIQESGAGKMTNAKGQMTNDQ